MMANAVFVALLLQALCAAAAFAADFSADAGTARAAVVLAADTVIGVQTIDALSSRSNKPGDSFRLSLAEPLRVGDEVLLPTGTPVVGEVVHAAPSTFGGKPGELVIAARYIDAPGGHIRLRSGFGVTGTAKTDLALGVAMVTFGVGAFIKGKEILIPSGTALAARIPANTAVVPAP